MKWELPDCGHWQGRFHLSAEEKRELIELLAMKGPGALDEFIAARSKEDSLIAAKVAAWRAELMARAARLKQALEEQFSTHKARIEAELAERERALHGTRDEVAHQLQDFRLTRDARLVEVLQRSELVQLALNAPPPRPSVWRRFLRALQRAWFALLRLLGLRKEAKHKRKPLLAAFPAAGRLGLDLGNLSGALYSDAMRQRVRSRLQGMSARERLKQLWQAMLGREDYETLAAKLMEEELQRELDRRDAELHAQEQAMSQRLADLAQEEERAREHEREELARLERERDEALRKLREKAEREPLQRMAKEVRDELELTGYLREGSSDMTQRLVDRFSELVFEAEMKALSAHHRASYGSYVEGEGVFRKEPLLSVDELSHADLVGSTVQARLRHPRQRHIYDDDVLVYREMRTSTTHVVLIFDTSGSMEENQRLEAAKRAALALYQAAKRDNKANRVDLVLMETSVRRADILEAWVAKPKGFTNTGGALALARALLQRSRADRKLVYLITDGLPEALTLPNGEDIASYPDKCLAYALDEARKLRAIPDVGFAVLLLEPEDEMYVQAAQKIAAELGGTVQPTDPRELARRVLVDFDARRKLAEAPRAR
ncbi:MAG TPA: VWA domain-containing protein [Candidatus Thermoplasmatota archaeon]|jgi:Mg-chelatase subunit ChlD|nr:VWA domain-containing protein [Candidatus Thermoplasmatota archaeon]